ncbi:MAG: HAD-IIIA family hydrolase, partial [Anaerolineae bacterium]|nr:HAD-IIIA family hydrolase [Anaerolineae bacterium]
MDSDLIRRIENIRLLALDVDGVLTDGGVYVFEDGTEFRRFNIKDGHGLKRLIEAGIKVAIISSASTKSVVHRAKKLGIEEVHLGVKDKLEILTDLCTRFKIKFDQVAYMGDDLLDLPVMKKVGLPCAPSDACDEILEQAQI